MSPKVTQLDKEIAARVRALREERQLSQPTVAGVLGVTYQSYQKIEAGRVSFRASTLAKLASLFGVPVEQLYGDTAAVVNNAPYIANIAAMLQVASPATAAAIYAGALKGKGDNPRDARRA